MKKAEVQDDGSLLLTAAPTLRRKLIWHKPQTVVPEEQWQSATGITRYEWARRQTPEHQRDFFKELGRCYKENPPKVLPQDLIERAIKEMTDNRQTHLTSTGMPAPPISADLQQEFFAHDVNITSPGGQWRFQITAEHAVHNDETNWGSIIEKLHVRHLDYRTLADWSLLMRLRSWILDDSREAFIYMPGTGGASSYVNARPNNMQIMAPIYDMELIKIRSPEARSYFENHPE